MMHDVTHERSLFTKAIGVVIGECFFGLFGPMLLLHPLRWFEINFPGAVAIGVVCGAALGYGVATAVLQFRHETASGHHRHPLVVSRELGANLHA
jgi:hypothetical protein